jgi:flagellar biosynthesis chaperone FliJ
VKITKLTCDLREKQNELNNCKTELKQVSGSGLYQRNRRNQCALKEKERNININSTSVQNAVITQLRQQIRGLQTQVATLKVTSGRTAGHRKIRKERQSTPALPAIFFCYFDRDKMFRYFGKF